MKFIQEVRNRYLLTTPRSHVQPSSNRSASNKLITQALILIFEIIADSDVIWISLSSATPIICPKGIQNAINQDQNYVLFPMVYSVFRKTTFKCTKIEWELL